MSVARLALSSVIAAALGGCILLVNEATDGEGGSPNGGGGTTSQAGSPPNGGGGGGGAPTEGGGGDGGGVLDECPGSAAATVKIGPSASLGFDDVAVGGGAVRYSLRDGSTAYLNVEAT
jgi:hypothetical protein